MFYSGKHGVRKGCTVFNSYGRNTNVCTMQCMHGHETHIQGLSNFWSYQVHLLLNYGFALAFNDQETVEISIARDRSGTSLRLSASEMQHKYLLKRMFRGGEKRFCAVNASRTCVAAFLARGAGPVVAQHLVRTLRRLRLHGHPSVMLRLHRQTDRQHA